MIAGGSTGRCCELPEIDFAIGSERVGGPVSRTPLPRPQPMGTLFARPAKRTSMNEAKIAVLELG